MGDCAEERQWQEYREPDRDKLPREALLEQAAALVAGGRENDYGDPHQNFQDIASLWSVLLGIPVHAWQVAQLMAVAKAARLMHSPRHEDSWKDMAGYAALGYEIATKRL